MRRQPIPSSLSRFGSQLERAIARELTQAAPSDEDNAVVPLAAHERLLCAELGDDQRRRGGQSAVARDCAGVARMLSLIGTRTASAVTAHPARAASTAEPATAVAEPPRIATRTTPTTAPSTEPLPPSRSPSRIANMNTSRSVQPTARSVPSSARRS